MASSLSPFSTGGAMVISGCPDPKIKEQLTTWMIPVSAVVVPAICIVLATVGLFGLFSV
jgi:hypothetical protein